MMIGPLSCCRNGHRSGAARIYLVCDIIFMDLLHSRSIFIAGPALQLIWHIDKFFLFFVTRQNWREQLITIPVK
jgi:hypothetical protein